MGLCWESPLWNGQIAIAFGYPRDGWLKMVWTTPVFNQLVSFDCADAYSPFEDLVFWIEEIAGNRLPVTFSIDEEGPIKHVAAAKSALESDAIEIRITDHFPSTTLFRCRTKRIEFVHEFIRRFETWLETDYDPFGFGYRSEEDYEDGYGFDLRGIDLSALKATSGYAHVIDREKR